MPTPQTNTSLGNILKTGYDDRALSTMMVDKHPGLTLLKHTSDFVEATYQVSINTGMNNNASADYSVAKNGAAGNTWEKFLVQPARYYNTGALDGLLFSQTKLGGSTGRLINAIDTEVKAVTSRIGRVQGRQLYGNRGGAIARIATIVGNSITLTQSVASVFFGEKMAVQFSVTDGTSGVLRDSGDFLTVQTLKRDTGEITFTTPVSDISGITVGDYVFRRGDFGAHMTGYADYNPQTEAALAVPLWGLVRNTGDVVAKAGGRYSSVANSEGWDSALQRFTTEHYARTGERPEYILMNPIDVFKIEKLKDAQKEVTKDNVYNLGIEKFTVYGIDIVPDPDCPQGYAQGHGEAGLEWKTCGPAVQIDTRDGLKFRKSTTADAIEFEAFTYGNFICPRPIGNFNISLPA